MIQMRSSDKVLYHYMSHLLVDNSSHFCEAAASSLWSWCTRSRLRCSRAASSESRFTASFSPATSASLVGMKVVFDACASN